MPPISLRLVVYPVSKNSTFTSSFILRNEFQRDDVRFKRIMYTFLLLYTFPSLAEAYLGSHRGYIEIFYAEFSINANIDDDNYKAPLIMVHQKISIWDEGFL